MNRKIILLFGLLLASLGAPAQDRIETGAEQTGRYLPLLEGRRVGIMTNHTGTVGRTHLVDTLRSLGVDIRVVFAPEHGFRGQADAGESVASYRDRKTGIDVVSVYGSTKRPPDSIMQRLDVLLFDIQDVGLRYYTYLSSMHYLMEACAANGKQLIVLDRPNPNGFYVDGPVLEAKHRSFVGMHPIPVVHGMTLGELARMIDGEGWLRDGLRCKLTVIPCRGYTHRSRYRLPTAPSPNLPNMRAVYLYPSLCFFEGTPISLGRGTDFPFQTYGHPKLQGDFSFTPRSNAGAKNPPLKDKLCHGVDLRISPSDERIWERGVDLGYVIDCYRQLNLGEKFFTPMFDRLTGTDYVRQMILQGAGADRIKARWADDVERFKQTRKPYLLYEE
ncbi:exo-beta-N-acetylmuramidase NamZ domain-containing protein [Alistipes ihumii]|uniref:exo-beta-N-acetylmuramidase NamZ family protein n=1 Tax=Alistipes ihumii TaxID=1470347 RepID=UPI002E98942C|nr:DUF1343 domain-containing protein [Alistipes ihumii]